MGEYGTMGEYGWGCREMFEDVLTRYQCGDGEEMGGNRWRCVRCME